MKNVLENKAFTLIELIIVIVLIGLIYGVFVNKLNTNIKKKGNINIGKLNYFLNSFDFNKTAQVLCYKYISKCDIYIDEKKIGQSIKLFPSKPKVYTLDDLGESKIVKFPPKFSSNGKQRDIIFNFRVFNNESQDSYIVELEKKFYVFKAIKKEPIIFDSLDKAIEEFDWSKILPLSISDYQY